MNFLWKKRSEEDSVNFESRMNKMDSFTKIFQNEFNQKHALQVSGIPPNSPKNPKKKKKRFRSAFTTDQIKCLESEFKTNPYISISRREHIAKTLEITQTAIKIWFQNRRMKEKKEPSNCSEEVMIKQNSKKQVVDDDSFKTEIVPTGPAISTSSDTNVEDYRPRILDTTAKFSNDDSNSAYTNSQNQPISPTIENGYVHNAEPLKSSVGSKPNNVYFQDFSQLGDQRPETSHPPTYSNLFVPLDLRKTYQVTPQYHPVPWNGYRMMPYYLDVNPEYSHNTAVEVPLKKCCCDCHTAPRIDLSFQYHTPQTILYSTQLTPHYVAQMTVANEMQNNYKH